jgi:hypothetical protein
VCVCDTCTTADSYPLHCDMPAERPKVWSRERETVVARDRQIKQVSAATNRDAIVEKLLETVFSIGSVPRL